MGAKFTVYVWVASDSVEADIVEEVLASSVGVAIEDVMRDHDLPYADYVWVVPADGHEECVSRYAVRCYPVQVSIRKE